MAADSWQFYDGFREYVGDGTIDLDGDTFIMGLVTSTYTFSSAHNVLTDITNEVTGNGYARDTLVATWVRAGAVVTFNSDNGLFTAAGGSITARRAFIFDDTVATPIIDPLVCSSLLDNAPADVTVTDTNTLTVAMNASGCFTLA